jgi:thioesterase domain-containing protein
MPNRSMLERAGLEAYLLEQIGPARAMQLAVEGDDPAAVIIAAPLGANRNDKGTGFAGSLLSVAALAGWAVLARWCAAESVEADVVLQSSSASFLAPARAAFRAVAHRPDPSRCESLSRMLARSGRGRVEIPVEVSSEATTVMSFEGVYAVLLRQ